MNEEKDQEQWIERIIQSVQTPEEAIPSPFLYSRIVNRISFKNEGANARPFLVTSLVGLCIFCLINIISIGFFLSTTKEQTTQTDDVAKEYYATETLTELYY